MGKAVQVLAAAMLVVAVLLLLSLAIGVPITELFSER